MSRILINDCLLFVCIRQGVAVERILSGDRGRYVTDARALGFYLARRHTDGSLRNIANRFGIKDDPTVLVGARRVKERAKASPEFAETLAATEAAFLTFAAAAGVTVVPGSEDFVIKTTS